MQNLKVSIFQMEIAWENPSANLDHLTQEIKGISDGEIIILPETFATGFTMNIDAAQTMEGQIVQWMKNSSVNRVICGSVFIKDGENIFNRFIWCENGSITYTYDKAHLFGLGGEHKLFTAGTKQLTIEYKGWRIRPFICYDLRFPVWNRNNDSIDLYIFVANWPEVRRNAWQKLLEARAIENQVYVAACNCVGTDGTGVKTIGISGLIDALGEWVAEASEFEKWLKVELDATKLQAQRKALPFLNDRDNFEFTS
jgi:predicted amidohydrolase